MRVAIRIAVVAGIAAFNLTSLSDAAESPVRRKTQDTPNVLADVEDGLFRCPEKLSTHVDNTNEMQRFILWTRKHHPKWTVEEILEFRISVLKAHKCTETLKNIQAK